MPTAIVTRDLLHSVPGVSNQVDPTGTVSAPYTAQNVGMEDIPDTTASGTSFSIPFGSIDVGATVLFIKNTDNQDVLLSLNGSADLYQMAPGGFFFYAAPVQPAGDPLLSAAVKLTDTQAGPGTVEYHVFGD